jgi:murein DD-endopeptidase MepM/ murein hydrolase activator NlpD
MRTPAFAVLLLVSASACAPAAPPKCAEAPIVREPPAAAAETAPKASAPVDPPAIAVVRGMLGPDAAATYATFSPKFREAIPFEPFAKNLAAEEAKLGKVQHLFLAGEGIQSGRDRALVIVVRERGVQNVTLGFNDEKLVSLFRLEDAFDADPQGPGPADDYVAKRAYALPASGVWHVSNGGPTTKVNGHVGNRQQWYGFDLDQRDEQGNEAKGDGKKNEDHFAFGQTVIAPADGTVVTVIDAVPDYDPGDREGYVVPGNVVIIDHGEDEFSVLAHFKKGSIVVKPGQKVKLGQKLGLVGNSGNTSDPHIHWHLATKGGLSRGSALPIRFGVLMVNGKRVENAKPVRGDKIENAK